MRAVVDDDQRPLRDPRGHRQPSHAARGRRHADPRDAADRRSPHPREGDAIRPRRARALRAAADRTAADARRRRAAAAGGAGPSQQVRLRARARRRARGLRLIHGDVDLYPRLRRCRPPAQRAAGRGRCGRSRGAVSPRMRPRARDAEDALRRRRHRRPRHRAGRLRHRPAPDRRRMGERRQREGAAGHHDGRLRDRQRRGRGAGRPPLRRGLAAGRGAGRRSAGRPAQCARGRADRHPRRRRCAARVGRRACRDRVARRACRRRGSPGAADRAGCLQDRPAGAGSGVGRGPAQALAALSRRGGRRLPVPALAGIAAPLPGQRLPGRDDRLQVPHRPDLLRRPVHSADDDGAPARPAAAAGAQRLQRARRMAAGLGRGDAPGRRHELRPAAALAGRAGRAARV